VTIVSAALQVVVEAFDRRLDAAEIGTPLAYEDGRLIGLGAPASVRARKAQKDTAHIGEATSASAYGDIVADNAADVPMTELSELPVAVFPNDELLRNAQKRGWRIMKGSQ
jgi:phosphoserine phosphatase